MSGEELRQARARRGWSQEELAGKAGVAANTIRRIETGHTQPRGRTLRAIVAALSHERAPALEDGDDLARIVRAWPRVPSGARRPMAEAIEVLAGFVRGNEAAPAGAR